MVNEQDLRTASLPKANLLAVPPKEAPSFLPIFCPPSEGEHWLPPSEARSIVQKIIFYINFSIFCKQTFDLYKMPTEGGSRYF
jgi:hypothetical protein